MKDTHTTRLGRWLDLLVAPLVVIFGGLFIVLVVLPLALVLLLLVRLIAGRDDCQIEYEKTWIGSRIEDCEP